MAAPSRPMATLRSGNGLSSNPDLEELDDAEAGDSVAEMSVRDMRTAVQRGKLGVAIAAGSHTQVTAEESIAHGANRTGPQRGKKKQSLAEASLGAIRKGDLKALGGHAVQAVRRPLRALAGGKDGQAANNLRGQTFNLDDLDPDADGDGVVSAFEKAVYERIRRIDKDGDGKLSIHELYDVVEEAVAAKQARAKDKASRAHSSQRCARLHPHPPNAHCVPFTRRAHAPRTCAFALCTCMHARQGTPHASQDKQFFKTLFLGTAGVVGVLLLCLTLIMAALMSVFKDTYTNPDVGMMRTASGKVVMSGSAKYPLPLYTAPVLQHVERAVLCHSSLPLPPETRRPWAALHAQAPASGTAHGAAGRPCLSCACVPKPRCSTRRSSSRSSSSA